jgi:hypothetical protein
VDAFRHSGIMAVRPGARGHVPLPTVESEPCAATAQRPQWTRERILWTITRENHGPESTEPADEQHAPTSSTAAADDRHWSLPQG